MIKRICFIFCSVLILVTMLAVPAFADETEDFYFITQPKDCFKKDGSNVAFTVEVFGDVASYRWEVKRSYNSDWVPVEWGQYPILNIGVGSEYYLVRCIVTSVSGDEICSDVAAAINYPNYFLYYCSRAIHFVTSWVGSITSALVSPDGAFYSLLPVLAIGIAVTAVLLVTKIFKSFSWGL